MVRNGLEKEGAKSEDFVVEPDLLTTNLGPKYVQIGSEYGPERFQKGGCKIRKFCCGAYIAHAQLGPKRCPNLVETYPNIVELPPCSCMVGGGLTRGRHARRFHLAYMGGWGPDPHARNLNKFKLKTTSKIAHRISLKDRP